MFDILDGYGSYIDRIRRFAQPFAYDFDVNNVVFDGAVRSDIRFPFLIDLLITSENGVVGVFAKVCTKAIAKSIAYPKTNEVPKRFGDVWKKLNNRKELTDWITGAKDFIEVTHKVNPNRIDMSLPNVGENEPSLAGWTVYLDHEKVKRAKLFVINQFTAKDLVYWGKKLRKKKKSNLKSRGIHSAIYKPAPNNIGIGMNTGYKLDTPQQNYITYTTAGPSIYRGYWNTSGEEPEEER